MRYLNTTATVAIAALALSMATVSAPCFAADGNTPAIWFDATLGAAPDAEAIVALTAYVDAALRGKPREKPLPDALALDKAPRIGFLSVSDGAATARVCTAGALGYRGLLDALVARAAAARRNNNRPRWIRLDIAHNPKEVRKARLGFPIRFLSGMEGIAFDRATNLAFTPGEIVWRQLVDDLKMIRTSRIATYLKERDGSVPPLPKLHEPETIYLFRTVAGFSDGKDTFALTNDHRQMGGISADTALSSARAASAYLVRETGPDGRYTYHYDPASGNASKSYNILRHAGTTYALLEIYEATGDKDALAAAERALKFLAAQARKMEFGKITSSCIVEDGRVKLGGNGLAILAFAKYTEVAKDRRYWPLMTELGVWILAAQKPETGEFWIHGQDFETKRVLDMRSEYYPGEALFALASLARLEEDAERRASWLEAAERGALFRAAKYAKMAQTDLPHDHWLMYALDAINRLRPNPKYLPCAMQLSQAIMETQIRGATNPDWVGGYGRPPRSTPASTRTEGLCAAYRMARDFGTPQQAALILPSIALAMRFQIICQYYPESVLYLPNPERALGAVHGGLSNSSIRIDFCQHHISAALAYRDILLKAAEARADKRSNVATR